MRVTPSLALSSLFAHTEQFITQHMEMHIFDKTSLLLARNLSLYLSAALTPDGAGLAGVFCHRWIIYDLGSHMLFDIWF